MSKRKALLLAVGLPLSVAALAGAAEASASALCVKGRAVSVLYGGDWYPAKVLDGPDRMSTCLVSYDGYGSNWDEWVSAKRMRPAAARQAQTVSTDPATAPASAGSDAVPAGKYGCYTFDNGQLNYAYTDVVIQAGGRYAVGDKGGRYTLSDGGAMRFTGTMANATGKFTVKNGGKPQIDLVFNGDARASMSCPKAR
ncbi:agenet domain-containing protein [Aromatoleum aromaticum]|uniref:agenet domain-containing protein n=1 Tax=Aromatoleum aromaticum TaxID=551760 RepID=UPI0002EBE2B1|nr:agenet domain-containing protein [Aromatoleum aromaticum]